MAVLSVPGGLMPRCIIEGEGVPSQMASHSESEMGVNSWLEDELYQQYLRDRSTVDESWRRLFETTNGAPAPAKPVAGPETTDDLQPLRGAAGRIAENMSASLSVPLATDRKST